MRLGSLSCPLLGQPRSAQTLPPVSPGPRRRQRANHPRRAHLTRVARESELVLAQSAWRRVACRSAALRATGLACMLLDLMALAAMSSACCGRMPNAARPGTRSEEHTSELQSLTHLV